VGVGLGATSGLCGIVILENEIGWFHIHTVVGGRGVDTFALSTHLNTALMERGNINIPSLLICSVETSGFPPLDAASCSSCVCISAHDMPQIVIKGGWGS
jgi:hypothetical protein